MPSVPVGPHHDSSRHPAMTPPTLCYCTQQEQTAAIAEINTLSARIAKGQHAEATRERTNNKTTPTDYFGHGTIILCCITQVESKQHIPPLYQALPNSTRRMECLDIEEDLQAKAHELGLMGHLPVVTL